MKEAAVQKWWMEKLRKEFEGHIYIFKVGSGPYTSRRGIADLCMSVYGVYYALEVKTDYGQLTKLQSHEIEKVNKSGAFSLAVYGKDEQMLERLVETMRKRRICEK